MFNITIEQQVLMKALEYLEPTVGKNTTGVGDNCLSMATTGNNSVEMFTTNTVEFTRLEAIVAVGGNTQEQAPYVDFKRFKGIISSIPANEMITIEENVNDININYALKKIPIKLVGCNNGMMPLPTNAFPSASAMSVPTRLISEALNNVCSIIIDSDSTPIYNCMRIETNGMNIDITALDMTGKRMFTQSGLGVNNNPNTAVLAEASKLKKSIKLFEDFNELEIYMDNNMIRIDGADIVSHHQQKTKGMISGISYYCRRLTGAYPVNIKQHFNPMPTEFVEINKEELANSFIRVKALEDKTGNGGIGFEAKNGTVIIESSSAYGNLEDVIQAENQFNSTFKTVFKHASLSDIMKVIPTDSLEIGVLPSHPTNYVIRAKGNMDVMFTIPSLAGNTTTP